MAVCGAATSILPKCAGAITPKPVVKKKWKMKMSAASVCYSSLPIEQAFERIGALGFDGIDIWPTIFHCKHLEEVRTRLGAVGLKKLLKKHKLEISAFSVYGGGNGFKKYAELIGKAGGGVVIRGSSGAAEAKDMASRMKTFIESLKPLVELAEENKAFLAIENHGNALLDSVDSFKAFTNINTSKHLGIALAPYHLQRIKAPVPDVIRICDKQLFYFYAWQHAGGTEQLPGIGPVDCVPWLKALSDIKYRRFVNPFMHGEPKPDEMDKSLRKSRDYLLDCYEKTVEPESVIKN